MLYCSTVHNGGLSEGSAQCNMCPLSSLASREVAAVSQGEAESDYWGKLVYIYSWTGTRDWSLMEDWLEQNQTLLWKQNCSKCNKIHRFKIMFCCVCKIFRKCIWWWQMVKVAALWDIAKYCQSFYVATVLESGREKCPDNVYCNQSSWLKNFPSALIWSILRWLLQPDKR